MTRAADIALIRDDSRACPICGRWALEFFVTMRRAQHASADCVNTRGPRKGAHFHTAADCTACGAIFEVER